MKSDISAVEISKALTDKNALPLIPVIAKALNIYLLINITQFFFSLAKLLWLEKTENIFEIKDESMKNH